MFVILFEVALVWVRVRVGLPVMVVFVFVLDVLMIMKDVRVCMRRISVRVFMSMLCGHFCSVSDPIYSASFRPMREVTWPR